MIRKHDELFCHQVVSTFDTPGTSAREWTERAWTLVHDTKGSAAFAAGFGFYPNRNVMDAFVCLTVEDKTQHIVRASRELRPNIDDTRVGPFGYECVEPLKTVRFTLGENQYGVSYDIEVHGVSPLYEEDAQTQTSRGRVKEDIKRMVQGARPSGWIKADGRTFEVNKQSWVSLRDRSWGVRVAGADLVETGVQSPEFFDGQLFNFVLMQFDDWGASFHIRDIWDDKAGFARRWHYSGGLFYPFGSGKEPLELETVEHDYQFDDSRPEQPRRFAGGRLVLTGVDGSKKEVTVRPITICYQGPGGYGLPYKGFIHGLWMGSDWMDGYRLDLTNIETRREIWGYVDYGCEFRCGNDVGYGTTEVLVVGKYPKYGYQGY